MKTFILDYKQKKDNRKTEKRQKKRKLLLNYSTECSREMDLWSKFSHFTVNFQEITEMMEQNKRLRR